MYFFAHPGHEHVVETKGDASMLIVIAVGAILLVGFVILLAIKSKKAKSTESAKS